MENSMNITELLDTVDKASVQALLNGESVWHLAWAFIWDGTPQGHAHWQDIHEGTAELTEEDREYLRSLL